MSYILDALRRADAERERGTIPGIHAQSVPAGSSGDASRRRATPLVWVIVGLSLALVAALAWNMVGQDAPRESVEAAPAVPPAVVTAPAPVAPAPAIDPTPAPVQTAKKTAPRTAKKMETPASAATPEGRIYALSELPEEVRQQLPTLVIGGSIYAATPANRMLIINGQLFHEGDKLAPDLSLEQIKLKAAVLRFKGYRYGVTY